MAEIGVDIGGTFTDVILTRSDGRLFQLKVPSTPEDLIAGVRTGVERILAAAGLVPCEVRRFAHGSTVAINALLERKGATTGILMTDGFEDTLEIGRQKRSRLYDLFLEPETPIFLAPRRRRIGIPERIAADGSVVVPLDEDAVRRAAYRLVRDQGATAMVVCYLFSFRNPAHEQRTRDIIATELPGVHVSLSSDVNPAFREYERLVVTALDAYLQGAVGDYVQRLADTLSEIGIDAKLQVMQSRGGLTGAAGIAKRPVSLLLSGLAAGVVGSRFVAGRAGYGDAISLDIGGTSCDIALIKAGQPMIANQTRLERFPLRMQMIDVNTIGAGGGSLAWLDDTGGLHVGPQSAGAKPGPACYGLGGTQATVTDASLILGYLSPDNFAGGELALDRAAAEAAVAPLASRLGFDIVEVAAGIHRILNAKMADEVRRVAIQRGHDPRRFALLPLGGAGPVHAGAVARELGIGRVVVPVSPGVLSAFGLIVADVEHDQVETFARTSESTKPGQLEEVLDRLSGLGQQKMKADGIDPAAVEVRRFADMRYVGQSYELTVALPPPGDGFVHYAVEAFHAVHRSRYGHCDETAAVEFVNLRTVHVHCATLHPPVTGAVRSAAPARPVGRRPAYFGPGNSFIETPVYARHTLAVRQPLPGPAIVEQVDTTIVIYPDQHAWVDEQGTIVMEFQRHDA